MQGISERLEAYLSSLFDNSRNISYGTLVADHSLRWLTDKIIIFIHTKFRLWRFLILFSYSVLLTTISLTITGSVQPREQADILLRDTGEV
jgi:hypothetical protein